MANTYKNIVITPNTATAGDPTIVFSGANSTVNTDVTLRVYPDSNGTISVEGSAGQLFSITNDLTGSIFSVNDVSGIPLIECNVTSQTVALGPYYANVGIGTSTPSATLDVVGTVSTAKAHILSQTLTDAATINWNAANGQIATVTLTAAGRTMAAPTNLKVGTYILHIIQDATGSRTITTWNAVFKWPGGVAPTLTTTASARDVISFVCDGTNLYGAFMPDVK